MSEAKSTRLKKPHQPGSAIDGVPSHDGSAVHDGQSRNTFDAIQAMLDEEPLSLAEEIVEECERTGTPIHRDEGIDRYNQIKQGDIHIAELQRMPMTQLIEQARKENIAEITGIKRQDLIFKI